MKGLHNLNRVEKAIEKRIREISAPTQLLSIILGDGKDGYYWTLEGRKMTIEEFEEGNYELEDPVIIFDLPVPGYPIM